MAENSSSKELLRDEFIKKIREAVQARDWNLMEHWAKQWINFDSNVPDGFKWLARAATALNKMQRAAYAYGRLLDFEPQNEEARNFFARYPSTLNEQSDKVALKVQQSAPKDPAADVPILSPDQRQVLSTAELELAQRYDEFGLFAQASAHFYQSFEWYPSQIAALGTARCYHKHYKSQEALRFLRQQLYYFPNWIEGRLLLGRILADIGQKADAQKEWQIVLQQEPNQREAFEFLRQLYLQNQ